MGNKFTYIAHDWTTQPIFEVDDTYFTQCDIHGDWCANSCFDEMDISRMIAERGYVDCPQCLVEIVGIGG